MNIPSSQNSNPILGSLNQPVSIPPDSSGFYGLWAHGKFMWISHFSARMSQTLRHIRFACRVVKNAHAQDILNQSVSPGGQCEVIIRHIDYGIRGLSLTSSWVSHMWSVWSYVCTYSLSDSISSYKMGMRALARIFLEGWENETSW